MAAADFYYIAGFVLTHSADSIMHVCEHSHANGKVCETHTHTHSHTHTHDTHTHITDRTPIVIVTRAHTHTHIHTHYGPWR
jgi:hypothetical protein